MIVLPVILNHRNLPGGGGLSLLLHAVALCPQKPSYVQAVWNTGLCGLCPTLAKLDLLF